MSYATKEFIQKISISSWFSISLMQFQTQNFKCHQATTAIISTEKNIFVNQIIMIGYVFDKLISLSLWFYNTGLINSRNTLDKVQKLLLKNVKHVIYKCKV